MKKLLILAISTIFVLALGAVYAEAFDNGITDFSGHPYGTVVTSTEPAGASMNYSGEAAELANGVTDFSGHPYGTIASSMEPGSESIESSGAGGMREGTEETTNGITVFSGDSNGVAISQGWGL